MQDIDEIVLALKDFQASFERSARAAESVETASRNIFKAAQGVAGLNPMFSWMKAMPGWAREVDKFAVSARKTLMNANAVDFRTYTEHLGRIKEQREALRTQEEAFLELAKNSTSKAATKRFNKGAVAAAKALQQLDKERLEINKEIAKLNFKAITESLTTARAVAEYHQKVYDAVADAGDAWRDFNHSPVTRMFLDAASATFFIASNLKQANGALSDRQKYLREGLDTQIRTGASLETITQSQKALVELGMEEGKNFRDQTVQITKLSEAFDVAASESAQLLNVSEKIGVSYSTMVNLSARIARATALNATEATRYATSIARSVQIFSGRETNASFAAATEQVLRLEAALKSTIGESGAIVELMESINRGDVRGEMFGLNIGGKFSGDPKEMIAFMDSLSVYASQVKSAGPFAAEVAKGLGQALGIQPKLLLSFDEVRKEYERQIKENERYADTLRVTDALDKAYNETMAETGQVFSRLKNVVMGFVRSALMPFVEIAKAAASGLLSFIDGLRRLSETFPFVGMLARVLGKAVLGGAIVLLIGTVSMLVRSLWNAAVQIRAAATLASGGKVLPGGAGSGRAYGVATAGALISGAAETYGSRDEKGNLSAGAAIASATGQIVMFGSLLVPMINALSNGAATRALVLFGTWLMRIVNIGGYVGTALLWAGRALMALGSFLFSVPVLIALAITAVLSAIVYFWDDIKDALAGAWNAVTGFFGRVWDKVSGFFSSLWTMVRDGCVNAFNAIVDWVKGAAGRAMDWVADTAKDLVGFGSDDVVEGIAKIADVAAKSPAVAADVKPMPDQLAEHTKAVVAATARVEAALNSQTESEKDAERRRQTRTDEQQRNSSPAERIDRSKKRA